ncbi:MAG: FAD/NAD(P)-binding protein [Betaproteobacteria bacterium]
MKRRVVIAGGGFTAVSLVVQLLRRTAQPLDVFIIEPQADLGRGLAYSATDPDHRLNGSIDAHIVDPTTPGELRQWCVETGLIARDPECELPSGHAFLRRGDFGAFLAGHVWRVARQDRLGSTLRHVRDLAVAASFAADAIRVRTGTGAEVAGDMLVVATGNPRPGPRQPFPPGDAAWPQVISDPLQPGSLDRVPRGARVLVVGGGLTALDIVSSLVRRPGAGPVHVVSRHGLRPRDQAPDILSDVRAPSLLAGSVDLHGPLPPFLVDVPATARHWCSALRKEIARAAEAGRSWHEPFDQVRNVVWKLWPRLPLSEQQRFSRRLRVFYDVHRFRAPPMNMAMVREAQAQGRVTFAAASVSGMRFTAGADGPVAVMLRHAVTRERTELPFDVVVNCTGLDWADAWKRNGLLHSLVEQGKLRVHRTGLGFEVGIHCEALDASSSADPRLRVVGPPTAGAFGDPLGVSFIAGQIQRVLPDLLEELAVPARS